VALFAAEENVAKGFAGRFASSDLFQLWHLKPSSSTPKQAPITLVRCDAVYGAAFRLPEDVAFSEEQRRANAARVDAEREAEWERLRKLYEVVERTLKVRPSLSPSRLRENAQEIGVSKHRVEPLVQAALNRGVLKVRTQTERGITVGLGFDPRRSIAEAIEGRASAGESSTEVLP
jgi:hypothetical protein